MTDTISFLIGTDSQTITWWQMSIRAAIAFFYILFLIRFLSIRAFARSTSFDIVLAILMGTTMSRALTGNARFFPTIAASAVLVILHRILAILAFRSDRIARWVKGEEVPLIKNGELDLGAMRERRITVQDILEALRSEKGRTNLATVQDAYLERSGKISVIEKEET